MLQAALADPATGWSLGVLGALGEFLWDAGEVAEAGPLHRCTGRGGIALAPHHPALRLIAWEEPGAAGNWRQGASLCLPKAAAAIGKAEVLTELGPDAEALRLADRAAVLFDLGLGFPHLRACVRTAEPALLASLRSGCGQPLFAADNPAGGAILAASPHRIFLSRLARVEVFQPIPPPGGQSPEGPHTHLLPPLLRARRAHAATKPLPQGWISCLDFHPGHPLRDTRGAPTPFDATRHAAFQALLGAYGLPPWWRRSGGSWRRCGPGSSPPNIPRPGAATPAPPAAWPCGSWAGRNLACPPCRPGKPPSIAPPPRMVVPTDPRETAGRRNRP